MKTTLTSLILFSALITGAHAGQVDIQNSADMVSFGEAPAPLPQAIASKTTRAEIRAVLVAARAAGQTSFGEAPAPLPQTIASGKTRTEVRAELAQAKAQGMVSFGELNYPSIRS